MSVNALNRVESFQGVWNGFYYPKGKISYRQDNYAVYFSLDVLPLRISSVDYSYWWDAKLQRYTNGSWTTISTEEGYVSDYSPSHRQWSNIAVRGASMRIVFRFYRREHVPVPGGGHIINRAEPLYHYTFPWTR